MRLRPELQRLSVLPLTLCLLLAVGCEGTANPTSPMEASLDVLAGAADVEVSISISPHALILGMEGTWVTVHTDIRYGSAVNASVTLEGVSATLVFPDDRGYLVAKFPQGAIEALVSPPEATLTLAGVFNDGTPFFGSDTILVRERGPRSGRR